MGNDSVGEFEQLVLLAMMHLGQNAYGVTLRREVEHRTGREISAGAIYTTLERMESRGLVRSRLGDPVPGRRGRPRRYYEILPRGSVAVARSFNATARMARGLVKKLSRIEAESAG